MDAPALVEDGSCEEIIENCITGTPKWSTLHMDSGGSGKMNRRTGLFKCSRQIFKLKSVGGDHVITHFDAVSSEINHLNHQFVQTENNEFVVEGGSFNEAAAQNVFGTERIRFHKSLKIESGKEEILMKLRLNASATGDSVYCEASEGNCITTTPKWSTSHGTGQMNRRPELFKCSRQIFKPESREGNTLSNWTKTDALNDLSEDVLDSSPHQYHHCCTVV